MVAELLLRGGADPDARDHSGRTAEALAEEMGQRRVVCMLAYERAQVLERRRCVQCHAPQWLTAPPRSAPPQRYSWSLRRHGDGTQGLRRALRCGGAG